MRDLTDTSSGEGHADFPQHPNIDTLPDLDNSLLGDITTSEVKEAINSLALNKASGPDNILPEHLKYSGVNSPGCTAVGGGGWHR